MVKGEITTRFLKRTEAVAKRYNFAYLGSILLLGLLLRLIAAVFFDLWLDEVFSIKLSSLPTFDLLTASGEYWDTVHPPLYYFFLKCILFFVGNDELSVRVLSLTSFIGSYFLLFSLLKKLYSQKLAQIAVLLYAVNPFFVNLESQARMYALELLLMLMTANMIIFFDFFRVEVAWKNVLILSFLLTLMFFTDYSSVWFLLTFLLLSLGTKNRIVVKNFSLTFFIFIALSSLHFVKLLLSFFNKAHIGSVPEQFTFSFFFDQVMELFGLVNSESTYFLIVFTIILFGFFTFVVNVLFAKKKYVADLFIIAAILVPVVLSAGISYTYYSLFFSKNLLIVGLAALVVIARVCELAAKKYELLAKPILVLIAGTFLYQSITTAGFNRAAELEDVTREIAKEIKANVYFLPRAYYQPLTFYYFPKLVSKDAEISIFFNETQEGIEKHATSNKEKSYYFFYSHTCFSNKNCQDLLEFIEKDFCIQANCKVIMQI